MFAKRSTAIIVIALTVFVCGAASASAQLLGTIKDVEQPLGASGRVDWTTGVITAVGIGAPPAQPANAAQARSMAERAAQVVAYRNLLEAVKGVQVDSQTVVEQSMIQSDTVRASVSGFIQGATIMDKKYMSDGSVEITIGMRLMGALADALLPKGTTTPQTLTVPPAGTAVTPGRLYTGLIVDARGLGARPAMVPKILNEDGKEVYGSAWINRDFAVREGMVGYLKDPAAAQTNPRVSDKPLMIKALKVTGQGRTDVVISNADVASLQGAAQNLSMLEKCRVIILVD